MGTEAAASESQGIVTRQWALWVRPPGWVFHLVVAGAALALLWAFTVPAGLWLWWTSAVLALIAAALVWFVRVVVYLQAVRVERSRGRGWWFLAAPVGGLLTAALLVVDLPLRARWALSRDAFEDALAEVRRTPDDDPYLGRRIGFYDIISAQQEGDAVYFSEADGGFIFTDGGFAYLPRGTDDADDRDYTHLGGPWYAWERSF